MERGALVYDYVSFSRVYYFSSYRHPTRSMLWPRADRWGPEFQLIAPLWIPPAAILATGMFFLRLSCNTPAHCSCGYSLSGLAPTNNMVTCPGCGATHKPLATSPTQPRRATHHA